MIFKELVWDYYHYKMISWSGSPWPRF